MTANFPTMPRKAKSKGKSLLFDVTKEVKRTIKKPIPGFESAAANSDSEDSSSDDEQVKGPSSKPEPLISSDEDDDDDDDDGSDSDSDSDVLGPSNNSTGRLDLEARSRAIEKEKATEAAESRAELQRTYEEETARQVLPNADQLRKEQETGIQLEQLHNRVQEVVATLSDFNARRDPGTSRQQYVKVLVNDLCTLYNYLPELVELLLDMFSAGEAVEFIEAQEHDRPVVIRTNTLKTRRRELAQALTNRGVNLDPLDEWSKVGLKVYQSKVPLGATPEYLAGHYMRQSAASMLPVMALDPQPNEKILDMCSAPGGKTSYISQLMANTGTVIANDLRADRISAVVSNLHRLGVRNCVVVNYDGRAYPKVMGGFDRVLLDAPCSGLGVISRDQAVKMTRTVKDIQRTAHLQKELLRAAVDAVDAKRGAGVIVYSTCSVSIFENEMVVDYILKNRDVKVVDTGLPFGKPGFTKYKEKHFHPSLALTRRYYPHSHNLDGFYVCRLQKLSNTIPKGAPNKNIKQKSANVPTTNANMTTTSTTAVADSTAARPSGHDQRKVRRRKSKLPLKVIKWKAQQREKRKRKTEDAPAGAVGDSKDAKKQSAEAPQPTATLKTSSDKKTPKRQKREKKKKKKKSSTK